MAESEATLQELLEMSLRLGDPARDYVILGEGNTSARIDEETFWVKGSGFELPGITPEGFVRVRFDVMLGLLEADDISDDAVKQVLADACVEQGAPRPSTEAFLHALLLKLEGVNFIAHTHPVPVNMITCAQGAEEAISGRLFPDEIVVCGIAPMWVPFADPGLALARQLEQSVDEYIGNYRQRPKSVWMQNHGLIALGGSAREAESITAMSVKAARILVGTYALGGPHFLTEAQANRIAGRPDELYRQDRLGLSHL